MLAIAAAASGGFLGLLFGIPRMLQGNAAENETDLTHGATTRPGATQAETFGHNTNLEQISDWLTKILVGVGLTQLVELPDALSEVSQQIAPALGGKLVLGESNASGTIGVAIIIYFALVGFSYGYLWTRIYLPLQFHRAVLRARVERGIDLSPIQQKENAEDGRAAPKGGDDKKTI